MANIEASKKKLMWLTLLLLQRETAFCFLLRRLFLILDARQIFFRQRFNVIMNGGDF